MAKQKQTRSISMLLAFTGVVLLALCAVAVIRQQDVLAGGLAVLSLGAMVLAALTPRLTGTVEMSLSGFKMELVKLTEVGRLADYSEDEILAAIEYKLQAESSAPAPLPPPTPAPQRRSRIRMPHWRWRERRAKVRVTDSGGVYIGNHADQTNVFHADKPHDSSHMGEIGDPLHEVERRNRIKQAKQALARGTPSSPEEAKKLRALMKALLSDARVFTNPGDFEIAIKLARQALAVIPQDSPQYTEDIRDLADTLIFRYMMTPTREERDEIESLLDELESARRRQRS